MAGISVDDLALLFRRAGLEITPEKTAELHQHCVLIETLIERVRAYDDGEPSEVFAPIESLP